MSERGYDVLECLEDIPRLSLPEQLMSLPELVECAMDVDIGDVPESKKVCIFGIGESSIAGDMISAYADDYSDVPVFSFSNGVLPGWIDKDTDVIIISFSGRNNIINAIYDGLESRARNVYCITNNGKLMGKCVTDGHRLFRIPNGLISRTALGYELGVLASLIQKMGVCDAHDRLVSVLPAVKEYRDSLTFDDRIESLKRKLHDNTIAIYGAPDFRPSFKRWKMSFNSDMGSPAFCGELPEFNHNEIVGWANHAQKDDDLRIIVLRGKYKSEVLTTIIDKTIEVLEESGRHVMDIKVLGSEPMEKNMRAILLGDYISQVLKHDGRTPMSWGESL